jgi:diketogulonate reductase-like aldo/keto reductase
VLLKYNMQRGVVVIPKASSPEHLAANLQDMFSWRLNNQQKVRGAAAAACLLRSSTAYYEGVNGPAN